MFGLDPVALAKAEIKKLDLNKNGVPDAIEALEAVEKGLDVLKALLSHVDAEDVKELLALVPARLKAKWDGAGLADKAVAELPLLPAKLSAAHSALAVLETSLK